jgi:hypothetical protein
MVERFNWEIRGKAIQNLMFLTVAVDHLHEAIYVDVAFWCPEEYEIPITRTSELLSGF